MPKDDKLLYCSFCGKSQHEVLKLIAGPSVFICEQCTDLCIGIIFEELEEQKTEERKTDVISFDELGMPNLESLIRKAQDKEK